MVLIDTAGRLQTQHNLMEELRKVHAVVGKANPDAPHETLLVLDATTGQNGLSQARLFGEAVPLTGVIVTKLDGSAQGRDRRGDQPRARHPGQTHRRGGKA